MISQLDLQAFLFERETSRIDLLNFATTIEPSHRVFVCRNHSFEFIENTIDPYLEYAGLGIDFLYSSYDDSLSFLELDSTVDMVILWLDLSAYQIPNLKEFIEERLNYLCSNFNGIILFVPCCNDTEINVEQSQVEVYELTDLEKDLGEKFLDLRLESFAGTKLSNAANLAISHDLGLNYLPALLRTNLKAIIVDLDNTLYQGVLGEDGVENLVATQGHLQLQTHLKQLSKQGFFLCIASKNDERDVIRLFEEREDFPLQLSDFIEVHANWNDKAKSVTLIAESLNISVDSILFVDDNMGELVSVLESHALINVIWAKDNAEITHNILANYPGLLKLRSIKEDSLRKQDTQANQQRAKVQSSLSKEEYIKDLEIELVYDVDNLAQVERVTELSNKTNQFIFSYARYSNKQVETLMRNDDSTVIAVSLSDRLSESGIIGVIVLAKQEQTGVLEECFVSCRALGRGIDENIVLGGIDVALKVLGVEQLSVNFANGERNAPAKKFNEQCFAAYRKSPSSFEYKHPESLIAVKVKYGQADE